MTYKNLILKLCVTPWDGFSLLYDSLKWNCLNHYRLRMYLNLNTLRGKAQIMRWEHFLHSLLFTGGGKQLRNWYADLHYCGCSQDKKKFWLQPRTLILQSSYHGVKSIYSVVAPTVSAHCRQRGKSWPIPAITQRNSRINEEGASCVGARQTKALVWQQNFFQNQ